MKDLIIDSLEEYPQSLTWLGEVVSWEEWIEVTQGPYLSPCWLAAFVPVFSDVGIVLGAAFQGGAGIDLFLVKGWPW